MPGTLTHSPARVVRQMLVDLGLGVAGDYDQTGRYTGGDWPVFAASEPDLPDECLTVYDTTPIDDGSIMIDGERQEHQGVQIRVRAREHDAGWLKARAVAVALDESVYDETVTIDGTTYLVMSANRQGGIAVLGKEPTSRRNLFTLNALVTMYQTS